MIIQMMKNAKGKQVYAPKAIGKSRKGQAGIVGGAITIVVLVIMALIVSQVITDNSGNFTGLSSTILSYVVPIMLLGGLVLAAMLGVRAMKKR